MAIKRNAVDIVIVGLGWTGRIMAKELASTGLKIVVLERGRPRDTSPDFLDPQIHDEVKYALRYNLFQNVRRETLTFRNTSSQTALPMRQLGSFLPGDGAGGAGVHWNGVTWRWLEWDHKARSQTEHRFGKKVIPTDMHLQDMPVSYQELEPYYDHFEKICATSGKAGHIGGNKVDGGNLFEGERKAEYPNPPMLMTQAMTMFDKAARDLGYHPFPQPSSNASQNYTNPDGVAYGQCHYCGYCERFGCEVNAKASPHFTVIPLAQQAQNVEFRYLSTVLKVNLDKAKKRATSVIYADALGQEVEQPAQLVILSAFALWNVHLMLLSGIGRAYDPRSGRGVVGRNYAYQMNSGATGFFAEDVVVNPFMTAGALGMSLDDFNGDNYDVGKAGYIGGGGINCNNSSGRPILYHPTPSGTPRWGSAWKKAVVENYNHAIPVGNQGSVMAYRQNYLDLDPTYKDAFGRPLMRMTFDFQENEVRQGRALSDVCANVLHEMGAQKVDKGMPPVPYSIVPYQSTHNTGGAVFGDHPETSAVNRYLQSWDVHNVFVTGACVLPQNAGKNPTGLVGALAYWAVDAIKNRYLKHPGPLVQHA